jgi:hypothetical protein
MTDMIDGKTTPLSLPTVQFVHPDHVPPGCVVTEEHTVAKLLQDLENLPFNHPERSSFSVVVNPTVEKPGLNLLDTIQDRVGDYQGCPPSSTCDYLATYCFPSDVDAQVLCDRMFDVTDIQNGEEVHFVCLDFIHLLDSKQDKTPDNHRAQLYIWQSATQCFHEPKPFMGHQPFWLNADGGVEEGSSTFLSIVKNFPISMHPDLCVPCVFKMSDGTLVTPPSDSMASTGVASAEDGTTVAR